MTVYIAKDIAALDVGGGWERELSTGTGTDGSIDVSAAFLGATYWFITTAGVPNSDGWEDGGTWTVEIEVDVGNMGLDMDVAVYRFDPDLAVNSRPIQGGLATAKQTLQMSRVFSPVAPTWDAPDDCAYRLGIRMDVTSPDQTSQTATIGLGTIANEVTADITEDNCGGTPAGPGLRMAGDYGPRIIVPRTQVRSY